MPAGREISPVRRAGAGFCEARQTPFGGVLAAAIFHDPTKKESDIPPRHKGERYVRLYTGNYLEASSIATATATIIPTMGLQRKIATLGIFSDIIRNLCGTTAAAFVRQMQQICTLVAAFILHAKRI